MRVFRFDMLLLAVLSVTLPVMAGIAAGSCPALPPPVGRIVTVSTVPQLVTAVNTALPDTTILIADGTYFLNGAYLWLDVPRVTLRSASGSRDAVVLDGGYQTTDVVSAVASDVTVADLTIRRAYNHAVHVMSTTEGSADRVRVYNLHIEDPGQQAVKVNPVPGGYYTDSGLVACSVIELTDAGRPHIRDNCYTGGIDIHQSRDWVIQDNRIEGFWCPAGLSEHGIHLWVTCRDPVVERNLLRNNARGIGLGMALSGSGRTYPDSVCPGTSGYVDHFRGTIRNNFVSADDPDLLASADGFDCGICLWNACGASVFHNTVYTADPAATFSAIEWRFPNTGVQLANNLVNDVLRQRDGAAATQSGNLSGAQSGWFQAAGAGDLHLTALATAAIDQVSLPAGMADDYDGQTRPIGPMADAGADEYGVSPAPAVSLYLPLILR